MAWIDGLLQRWENSRLTPTQVFWIGAGCVIATLIAGFGFAGWVTGGKAQSLASEAAASARHELAAAVCAEEFMQAANAEARLAKLNATLRWERSDALAKAGWATMPDRKEPNGVVAEMCASRLSETQPPAKATPASATLK